MEEWKAWSEMTEQERKEERAKQIAAMEAFMAEHGKEPWVTIVDPDGAVHSVPQSLYRRNVPKQGEAEDKNKSE